MLLLAAVVAALTSMPPAECPFFTIQEAARAMDLEGNVDMTVTVSPLLIDHGVRTTSCSFSTRKRQLLVTRIDYGSAEKLLTLMSRQRAMDVQAARKEAEDKRAQAAAEAESPELRGDPNAKMTPEEEELYYPKRVVDSYNVGLLPVRYKAEPHNFSAEIGTYRGQRSLSAVLQWQGRPSEERDLRPALKSAFQSAVGRV
jgi:hypothetical protein